MEEILASIKRVIAEEGSAVVEQGRAARRPVRSDPLPPPPPPAASEDVLELDNPVPEDDDRLISQNAASASRQSLAALAAMRQNGEAAAPRADHAPLEAVVREMLRPMLRDWLDQHLPELVQELVTREITRITGRSI